MKLITLITASLTLLSLTAQARDLSADDAQKLRDSGNIVTFETLNKIVSAQHPKGIIYEAELDKEWGRYVYQLELIDAQGMEWDMELDAATGEILKNRQDD
ncbi:peptidase [Cellvibrio sp. KY-GH-1]|uniref:PepSY domain-containing protein n=1 Tax=Cellvibrio sp. KY-GH-1 TaxID=2303332 RepID=UPI0012448BB1|nr:PepSY domain-containing protein [Cellvibrio sp. KY-GH-1]QEY17681.1 peptidase [Cellvibrio sp. KY-GH-1]